ncbi:ATP-binding cassette domain-containing protein [Kitasatospora camelliae]|uniref:ATP-binding cassette domain-containing protein n=1 Tax=Kitasatospora camelliae TaxID=3156397 RepID=A0AAU8JYT5_9ACTN
MSTPVVEFREVGLTLPGPPPATVLGPCGLTVRPGEYLAVTGPPGEGRSALVDLLGLLTAPTRGRYLLDGVDTTALTDRRRSALRGRRIGLLRTADLLMPDRTAAENAALALLYTADRGTRRPAERLAAAGEALARVGLAARAARPVRGLTPGERRRVALARALAADPVLLVCEEPSGGLAPQDAEHLLDLMDGLNADGLTVVLATGDGSVAARADRVVTVRGGVLRDLGWHGGGVWRGGPPAGRDGSPGGWSNASPDGWSNRWSDGWSDGWSEEWPEPEEEGWAEPDTLVDPAAWAEPDGWSGQTGRSGLVGWSAPGDRSGRSGRGPDEGPDAYEEEVGAR